MGSATDRYESSIRSGPEPSVALHISPSLQCPRARLVTPARRSCGTMLWSASWYCGPHPRKRAERDEGHRTATRTRPEPLARQHHARSPRQRDVEALHRRILGHRTDVEPDDLQPGDQEQLGVRRCDPCRSREGAVERGNLLRPRARRHHPGRRPVPADLGPDGSRGRLGLARGVAPAGVRRDEHAGGRQGPVRPRAAAQPLHQDPGHEGRASGHRGGHRRRHPGQRDAPVLARALRRSGRRVPPRDRAADRRRPRPARRLGGVDLHQPLGRRGRRQGPRVPQEPTRDRDGGSDLRGGACAARVTRPPAHVQLRGPSTAPPLGQHRDEGPAGLGGPLREGARRAAHRQHDARGHAERPGEAHRTGPPSWRPTEATASACSATSPTRASTSMPSPPVCRTRAPSRSSHPGTS